MIGRLQTRYRVDEEQDRAISGDDRRGMRAGRRALTSVYDAPWTTPLLRREQVEPPR